MRGSVRRVGAVGLLFGAGVLAVACGGKVTFVEGSGTGEIGGAASTSTHATTSKASTSSTGSPSCNDLLAAFQAAVANAQACDPTLSSIQCDGSIVINDTCDCPDLILNENNKPAVQAAVDARAAWVAAKCGPFGCGAACFPATVGGCATNGMCVAFQPD